VNSARKKITDAIINGKIIFILWKILMLNICRYTF
jgi:predicted DNA-binding protein (UPF0251 family)